MYLAVIKKGWFLKARLNELDSQQAAANPVVCPEALQSDTDWECSQVSLKYNQKALHREFNIIFF